MLFVTTKEKLEKIDEMIKDRFDDIDDIDNIIQTIKWDEVINQLDGDGPTPFINEKVQALEAKKIDLLLEIRSLRREIDRI